MKIIYYIIHLLLLFTFGFLFNGIIKGEGFLFYFFFTFNIICLYHSFYFIFKKPKLCVFCGSKTLNDKDELTNKIICHRTECNRKLWQEKVNNKLTDN